MVRPWSIVAPVLLSMAFTACAEDGSPGDGPSSTGAPLIIGVTWILVEESVEALIGRAVPDALPTMSFDGGGGASGSTGCNRFSGTYTARSDGSLSIDVGGMTLMGCEMMQLEAAYTAALTDVASFEVADGGAGLVLTGAAAPLSYAAERPLPLEGTSWVVDGIAIGNEAVSSTIAGAEADAGLASGSTGCNRLMGSYTIDGGDDVGSISLSDVATTMQLCETDVAEQQQAILSALGTARGYTIEGSTLSLSDANGSFLLSLVGS